jgi:hypothetical protein
MSEIHSEIHTEKGIMRGIIHIPKVSNNKTIIIYHGYFSANRVGPARLYIDIARFFCNKGFAVVRFDCLGVGDSDGSFSDVTFDSFQQNFIQIYEYTKNILSNNQYYLIGHSFGANILCISANSFSREDKILLLAPEVKYKKGLDSLFNNQQINDLAIKGWTIRKGLYINGSFINVLRNQDIKKFASCILNDVILIQGSEDELYCIEGVKELSKLIKNCIFYEIIGADHNFLDLESKENLLETIYNHFKTFYDRSDN